MKKGKKLIIYSDPAHGWMKIPRKELIKFNIEYKISSCSYQRKDFVYLEEDMDMTTYINALKEKGIVFDVKIFHGNKRSKIRNYESYKA